jgi:two-component system nitrogen regulation response regulator GlnG
MIKNEADGHRTVVKIIAARPVAQQDEPMAAQEPETIDILVLDDEESIRWVMGKTLTEPGWRLHFADSAEAAVALLETQPMDFALVDINLPGEDGLSFLETQRTRHPHLLMAVVTGESTMHNAVTAMKLGAFDYLTKPFDIEEVEALVRRAAQTVRQGRRHQPGAAAAAARPAEGELIVGRSRAVREVHKAIGRVAPSDLTVLILGESGTGKELIARAIHLHSPQARHPFVGVNCAAIPRDLLEAELFGYEKGAFTGAMERKAGKLEAAGDGTIFLDEIGDMSLELQAKLLRVLQEREFQRVGGLQTLPLRARVLTATNQSLEQAVVKGRFRQDLFYRINAFTVHAAPLREIREDIPLLSGHFLRRYAEKLGLSPRALTPEAQERLMAHDWPGNVRELENVMKSLVITARTNVIDVEDLPRNIGGEGAPADLDQAFEQTVLQTWQPVIRTYCADGGTGLLQRAGEHLERPLIRHVLNELGWNQVRAAKVLGINRNTLRAKIRALGIRQRATRGAAAAGASGAAAPAEESAREAQEA